MFTAPQTSASRSTKTRIARTMWWIWVVALGAWLVSLIWRQLGYGLEYDESYLLGVVRNLAEGRGYVDDGVTFLSTSEAFSPVISTGPVVVLPAAAGWLITDGSLVAIRLVTLAFFALLLASTWLLFQRLGGRWVALAAVSGFSLLPLASADIQNASLMPGRLVGELPAMALLVLAAWLLARNRAGSAGLVAGLAIEAKGTFIIAIGVMVVALTLWRMRASWRATLRHTGLFMAGAAAPVVTWEAYKALSLGTSGYVDHLASLQRFSADQDVPWELLYVFFDEHVAGTAALISPLLIAVVGVWIVAVVSRGRYTEPDIRWGDVPDRAAMTVVVSMTAGMVVMFLWWFFRSQQYSARPAVPVIAWIAVVAAGLAMLTARQVRQRRDILGTALVGVLSALLVLSLGTQAYLMVTDDSGRKMLADQQGAAAWLVQNHGSVPADDYWTNPELLVLTGLPADTSPLQVVRVYSSIRALNEVRVPDAQAYNGECARMEYTTPTVTICRALPR